MKCYCYLSDVRAEKTVTMMCEKFATIPSRFDGIRSQEIRDNSRPSSLPLVMLVGCLPHDLFVIRERDRLFLKAILSVQS